jgi:hypothetical protein
MLSRRGWTSSSCWSATRSKVGPRRLGISEKDEPERGRKHKGLAPSHGWRCVGPECWFGAAAGLPLLDPPVPLELIG